MTSSFIFFLLTLLLVSTAAQNTCEYGQYLDLNTTECLNCNDELTNCAKCSQKQISGGNRTLVCLKCEDGWTPSQNGESCVACEVFNCQVCSEQRSDSCLKCIGDFMLTKTHQNQHNLCVAPDCHAINPALAFNGMNCVCPEGKFFQGNSCVDCTTPNCLHCENSGKCIECNERFFMSESSCKPCQQNCRICSKADRCLLCESEYFLNQTVGKCSVNRGNISNHIGTFQSKGAHICQIEGCTGCSTAFNCSACKLGYILKEGKCLLCPQNCIECELWSPNSDKTRCIRCFDGNAYQDGICVDCRDSTCLNCKYNSQYCIAYAPTITMNRKGSAVLCPTGCSSCAAVGKEFVCSTCIMGYFLGEKAKCYQCLQGVLECEGLLTPATKCDSSALLYNGVCVPCSNECQTCINSPDECGSCRKGFHWNGKRCLSQVSLPCVGSDEKENSTSSKCTSCLSSYRILHAKCRSIPVFMCNLHKSCEDCPLHFGVFKGVCSNCQENCLTCVFQTEDQSVCIACNKGMFIRNGSCTACPQGCSTCDDMNTCINCADGLYYYRDANSVNGGCEKCFQLCQTCELKAQRCTSCPTDYFLNNTKCYPNKNASFTITFDNSSAPATQVEAFIKSNSSGFLLEIAEVLQEGLPKQPDLLYIVSLGGNPYTVVLGVAISDASTVETFKDSLAEAPSIGKYALLSGDAVAMGQKTQKQNEQDQQTEENITDGSNAEGTIAVPSK